MMGIKTEQLICAITILACAISYSSVDAKTFGRCELARELSKKGATKPDILEWVCIAEYESGFKTDAMNKLNDDGSWDWGIFQINDHYWCKGHHPQSSNGCNRNCNVFLGDDISEDFRCAKIVKSQDTNGWAAWMAWRQHCRGNVSSKKETEKCFREL